jgi:DNA (cytosine-5)-methyltransferase 1
LSEPSLGGSGNTSPADAASTGRDRSEAKADAWWHGTERRHCLAGDLTDAKAFDWDRYEAAIHRWEVVIGRRAPKPIECGARGQPRLSSRFVEWLMGLPAGYATGLGLPRSAELRVLGNGVVPHQAEAALQLLCRNFSRG